MAGAELAWCSAVELVELFRAKRATPSEALEAVLAQADRWNPRLNAVVTWNREAARAEAAACDERYWRGEERRPLAGVPVTVKDLHLTAGLRTTMGSQLFANFVPDHDQPIVARLKRAGAIVIGKTNTSEFGILPLAASAVLGDCSNPWNLAHNTGGSSGGSAAAVASGMGPLATGSDGGGSIRIPAAFCGVFGLKPQLGRIAHRPWPRGWENLSHQGPISRTVRDAARMLDATAGPLEADRWSLPAAGEWFEAACGQEVAGLRIGWAPTLGSQPVDPDVASVAAAGARRLADLGCLVEEVELDFPDLGPAQQVIVLCEAAAALGSRRAEWESVMFRAMRKMLPQADRLTAADLLEAHWARDRFTEQVAPWFERYDVLATPTAPIAAPLNGGLGPKQIAGQPIRSLGWLGLVVPWNMTGQPAASLPVGLSAEGLPVGLQLVSRRFDEATLFRLASAYEAAWPWPLPPLASS